LRIFALSDIHIDYEENRKWSSGLSTNDYKKDILILAGDITDRFSSIEKTFRSLIKIFSEILYIPGNHDLWVLRDTIKNSFEKLKFFKKLSLETGIRMEPYQTNELFIIPLYAWYDYTFGLPSKEILNKWVDYIACKWPEGYAEEEITRYFISKNESSIHATNKHIISFSHFVPRIDLMPIYIPVAKRNLYPVLGTTLLEDQIRRIGSNIHIYGHTHVNANVVKDNIRYINNAFGYPYENHIAAKKMLCVQEV
jgi:predicted phosphodiesterase